MDGWMKERMNKVLEENSQRIENWAWKWNCNI